MKFYEKIKLKKIKELETLEEKSFWIMAPIIALIGVAGLFTSGSYETAIPTIVSAILCLVFPLLLIMFVYRKGNYHVAYPLLCIAVGALCVPITFITSGGYLSGMPIICAVTTAVTALCYNPKLRLISFIICLVFNSLAYAFAFYLGTPYPLAGTEIIYDTFQEELKYFYKDVLFGYFASAGGLFLAISFITADIRRYKLSQDALQRYFDIEKRKEILNKTFKGELISEHKTACILFADISNFTPIAERMDSDTVSKFLNEFFTSAGRYIHENGGIIDKFIGDCIMAYWVDSEDSNCVLNAITAIYSLKHEIYQKAEDIFNKYGCELNFSAGIAYGDVIFGDIGSDAMHDYTVIGDAVNTASRIQDFAVSGEMLISEQAAQKVKDSVELEKVENDHFFKGKNHPIDLYRVTGMGSIEQQSEKVDEKELLGYNLYVCGCRGSFPVSGMRFSEYGGETSCYVIKKDEYAVIVDCGTGLKNAMNYVQDCKHIDILLTHVHYDHILGFLMSKFPSGAKIRVFGNFDVWDKENNKLDDFMKHPYWPVELVNVEKKNITIENEIKLEKDIAATFYHSDHPDDACVIKVTFKNRKVVFLADCEDATKIDPAVPQNADIVFFDGMFDDTDKVSHKGWGHGTWQDGIRYLEGRNITKLVITHHNPELGDHALLLREEAARDITHQVSFAKSGDTFIL